MQENHNGQDSIMLDLIEGLLHDVRVYHQLPKKEVVRDLKYITSRVMHEGSDFLTKTLPKLGKSFDQALVAAQFNLPLGFKYLKGTKLPLLFNRLFQLVFDLDGGLREDACVSAVKDIRQLAYLFYKYELPYRAPTVSAAIEEFIKVDSEISTEDWTPQQMAFIHFANEVANEALRNYELLASLDPRNGPGSVANGAKPWQRFKPHQFYVELDELVPYDRMFYYNDRHLFDHFDQWFELPYGSYGIAKLMAVPKDSRGPRLISAEQPEYMTYEQALARPLVKYIETHPLTRGRVNFTNQRINGDLALQGSVSGMLATLDLSAASDRLSLDLVDAVFAGTPIHNYVMKARSTYTDLSGHGHGKVKLKKYAPMGSALTFPIQALTFFCLIVGALIADGRDTEDAAQLVYVFGDDIIVPTRYVDLAVEALSSVGLKVNEDKSCTSGHFRESCGVDAFRGVDVTPIKLKKVLCSKPGVPLLHAWTAYSDDAFRRGLWNLASRIERLVVAHTGPLPLVSDRSPVLGLYYWRVCHGYNFCRGFYTWDPYLQTYAIKGISMRGKKAKASLSGWERMVRFAWYGGNREVPFSTGSFTERNAVKKLHAQVGVDFV